MDIGHIWDGNLCKEIGKNFSQGFLVLRVTFINTLLGQVIPWDDFWRIFLYTLLASISEDDILWPSLQVWRIHSIRSLQNPVPCWQPELCLFFQDKVPQSNVLWWENNYFKTAPGAPPALLFLWYVCLGRLFNLWVSISLNNITYIVEFLKYGFSFLMSEKSLIAFN